MSNSVTTHTVSVDVIASGLQRLIDELRGAGSAVETVNKKQREGTKTSRDFYDTQAKGVLGTANSTKSFAKMEQTLGNKSSGLVHAYATLAVNAFAVSAAFNTLRSAHQAQQLLEGLETQGAKTGKALVLTSNAVREITGAAVSSADAMKAVSQFTAAGFSSEQLLQVTQVATDASKALGRNIPDSLDRIIKGASKLEPELLDELGLMTKLTESSKNYALANGKSVESLSTFEKSQGFVNSIIAEGTLKYGGLSDKVKASPYDQLASSFDNLTKNILNMVNALGGLKIISIIASSSFLLAGTLTLFAGSLAKQVVPSLYEFSEAAVKAGAALEAKIEKQKEQIALNVQQAKSDQLAAKQQLISSIKVDTKSPQRYKDYIESVKAGTATEQQRELALKSLDNSITRHETILRRSTTATQEQIATRQALIATLREQSLYVTSLAGAEIAAAEVSAASVSANAALRVRSRGLMLQASAQTLRADAIELASQWKLNEAFLAREASIKKYALSLRIVTKANYEAAISQGVLNDALYAGAIAFDAVKVGAFEAVTAVKSFAAAMLSALAWIGIIAMVIAAAYEGYQKFLVPESTKAKAKAIEDLKIVVENTSKAIEEYNRLGSSTASLSTRTEALLTNQANSALELASAYTTAYDAIKKANEEQAKKKIEAAKGPKSVDPELAKTGAVYGASQVGLAVDNLAVSAFTAQSGFLGFNKETQQVVKSLDGLVKINPEVAKGLLENKEQAAAFNKLSYDEKLKKINQMALQTADRFKNVVPAVTATTAALKQADTETTAFLKSMIQTTPFDKMVDSLHSVNNALFDLDQVSVTTADKVALLTGMGPDLQRFMTPENSAAIEGIKLADATIQRLNAKKEAGEKLSKQDDKAILDSQEILKSADALLPVLKTNLKEKEREFKVAQQNTREAQLQAGLVQAIMSKNAAAYAAGAAGMKAQIAREEQIRGLQTVGLKAQKALIDASIAEQKESINKLKTELKTVDALKEQGNEIRKNAIERAKDAVAAAGGGITAAIRKIVDPKARNAANLAAMQQEAAEEQKRADIERAKKQHNLEESEHNLIDLQSASKALQIQISTIMSANLSTQQKKARETAAENQLLRQESDLVRKNARMKEDNARALTNLMNTANGTADTVGAKLQNIASTYASDSADATKKFSDEVLDIQDKINIATTDSAKAPALEKAGYDRLITSLNITLAAKQEEQNLSLAALNIAKQQQELEAIGLNTVEQRVAKQKEALSFAQYELDALKDSVNTQSSLTASINAIQRKKTGVTDTATSQSMDELENAQTAYKLAAAEVKLKVTMINLEFALIAAKRTQMLDEMKKSATELADKKFINTAEGIADPQLEARIKAANDIIKSIESVGNMSLEAARDSLIKAAYQSVDILKNGITLALTEGPKTKGGFLEQLANARQMAASNAKRKYEASLGGNPDYAPGFKPDFGKSPLDAESTFGAFESNLASIKDKLKALGPQGELVLAVSEGAIAMRNSWKDFTTVLTGDDLGAKIAGGLEVAAQAINMVQGILKASSDAKIAMIDKEIAAEQKRDGKSASSVAKIAEMEKKKQTLAKKSFDVQKKLQMAQIVVSTAAAIAGALSMPPIPGAPWNIALASMMGALGAAQLAIVAGTSFDGGGSISAPSGPSTLSIGKQSSSVDLAKGANANAGGEVGFLRGSTGQGSSAADYRTIGSAYGGEMVRGYGSRGFVVGEKGPEKINMDTPITVSPVNDNNNGSAPINANINIHAMDSSDVQRVLVGQKGNIIKMLREAANASGKSFMEDVNVNVYTRPGVNRL